MRTLICLFFLLGYICDASASVDNQVDSFKDLERHYNCSYDYSGCNYLGQAEIEVIDNYKFYRCPFNQSLRGLSYNLGNYPKCKKRSILEQNIMALKRVFNKFVNVPRNLVLYRGISLGFRGNVPYELNEVFTDPAFISTSTNINIAKRFANQKSSQMLHIVNSGNVKSTFIGGNEEEVLLFPGSYFKIIDTYSCYGSLHSLTLVCSNSICSNTIRSDVISDWREKISSYCH